MSTVTNINQALVVHELVQVLSGDQLKQTHPYYTNNYKEWNFLNAAYEGTKALVQCGFLERHERESLKNYNRRTREAFGFNYSRSVVDLFNFYLFKEPVKRTLNELQTDEQWLAFADDCNLYGDDFDTWITEQSRYASINGHMGILVDKSAKHYETLQEEIDNDVYPYVASYFPGAILDWQYDRDENNRPFLAYLKLLDDTHDRDQYRIWFPHKFQIWELPSADAQKTKGKVQATMIFEGDNPLGEIPFVWLFNMRSKWLPIGVSDIHEVARIDVSILRNLSHGEEVITYAAFPMMRKPAQEAKASGHSAVSQKEDEAGVTAILEFDPEHPESKPDWLDSQVGEPVDAILKWIERKVSEIYRATNVGGQAGMEISTTAKSGAALKAEFQLLNSNLTRKAVNLEKAEERIMYYWKLWQDKADVETSVERSRTYDIENLAADLENAMMSNNIVRSKKFRQLIQKAIARQMLPAIEDEALKEIDLEIEEAPEGASANFDEGASNFVPDEGDEE